MKKKKYSREIKRSRWPDGVSKINEYLSDIGNKLDARNIVQEMKMNGEESALSIWNLDEPKDLVLSLITPGKQSVEKMCFIKIDEDLLVNNNLILKNDKGESLVDSLNNNHYDIVDMKYNSLGNFSKVILESLKNEKKNLIILTKNEVVNIIKEAIEEGLIDKDRLNNKLVSEIFK